MGNLNYCKKCGRICYAKKCEVCESNTFEIPDEYLVASGMWWKSDQLKQEFIETYIKTAPEFDQYYFDHREEISNQKHGEHLDICFTDGGKTAYVKGSNQDPNINARLNIKCSYCGSSNVKKIGVVGRAVSFKLFGIASGKIGKQWHCNSCGSDF